MAENCSVKAACRVSKTYLGEMVRHEGISSNEATSICGKRRGPVPFVLSLPNDPLAEASTIGISRTRAIPVSFFNGTRIDSVGGNAVRDPRCV